MPRAVVATFVLVVVAAAAAVQAAGSTKLVVTDLKRRTLQVNTYLVVIYFTALAKVKLAQSYWLQLNCHPSSSCRPCPHAGDFCQLVIV